MKKTFTTLFFSFILLFNLNAQTLSPKVLPSAGGYFSAGGKSLSWTLGETFSTSLSAGNILLTQGFQQSYVELTILNLRAFLEGYYEAAVANGQPSGQMNDNGGVGCLLNKIGASPNYNDVDTIEVSAMGATGAHVLIGSKKGIIDIGGHVTIQFGPEVVAGNSYYIRVKHHNSIETWSMNPVLFNRVTNYDFTTAANKAYDSNQMQTSDGLFFAFYQGDISDAGLPALGVQDGIIESQDYGDMENAVSVTKLGYTVEDLTGDAIVESADYGLMENNVYFTRVAHRP